MDIINLILSINISQSLVKKIKKECFINQLISFYPAILASLVLSK
jgi:hypothetical protein